MNNDTNLCICLKNCGCDIRNPLALAHSLRRMILTPEHKLKLLNDYCKETGNVVTMVLQRIVGD